MPPAVKSAGGFLYNEKGLRKKATPFGVALAEKERFAVGLSTVAWSRHALAGSLLPLPALGGFASPFLVPRTEKGSLLTRRGARVQMVLCKKATPFGVALAEKERFGLSRRKKPTYTLSRGASSTT